MISSIEEAKELFKQIEIEHRVDIANKAKSNEELIALIEDYYKGCSVSGVTIIEPYNE